MGTDRELVEKVKHGEKEAYGQLFQKYYSQIYAICLAMLRNPHDAEELTQEVFILAYMKLGQLRKPGRFLPWLKKITRNQGRNRIKKTDPKIVPLDSVKSHEVSDDPESQAIRQELMDSIMQAIRSLPGKDREVVQARIDGLSHTEISRHFGISIQSSMNRLHRARKQLAEHMKGLLSMVIGLPRMLTPGKIITGGTTAMTTGTAAKVTIGIIGILMLGGVGFLVTKNQLEANKPNKDQIAATTTQDSINNTTTQSVETSSDQNSIEHDIAQRNEMEKWYALMDVLNKVEKASNKQTTGRESNDSKVTPSIAGNNETNKDQSKAKYHESYDTFVSVTRKIGKIESNMESLGGRMKGIYNEWASKVRDPKNPTDEEKAELNRIGTLKGEYGRLENNFNSLADELIDEVNTVAPNAVQTESRDYGPKGTVNIVRIDYNRIRSVLGSLPEETDTYLSEFFANFERISYPDYEVGK